ncbi:MAG: class I SAM-dependent methyltransferase [Bacteroidetes bacterium]|nr:class I SAM-dependent methyltransferase [Bacteroidota bacterium]
MFDFHHDRDRYFEIQWQNARQYVGPFVERSLPLKPGMRVLEIGCGEGGMLKAFWEKGCTGVGVELDAIRVNDANRLLSDLIRDGAIRIITKDIYEVDREKDLEGTFDLILLKDVIEHIHDQPRLIGWMKNFLNPEGMIFFGFPPWQMPFGGHQQICRSRLSRLPYVHLLPKSLYRALLKWKKEPVEELMEIRETRLSIERFERICEGQGYQIVSAEHYLLNPIYKWKFGWSARKQFFWVKGIPYLRNYLTTCVYYLIKPNRNLV